MHRTLLNEFRIGQIHLRGLQLYVRYTIYLKNNVLGFMALFPFIPDSSWWANGYRGSWLIKYNIYTHEAKNWGVPLIGNMLPCFNVDTIRGRLVGTGANHTVLCWDCINKKVPLCRLSSKRLDLVAQGHAV